MLIVALARFKFVLEEFIIGQKFDLHLVPKTYVYCFVQDAEKQSIEMQEQLEGLREEKERLLNSLVEAE